MAGHEAFDLSREDWRAAADWNTECGSVCM